MGLKRIEFENLVDVEVATSSCYWPVADGYVVAGGWITPTGTAGVVRRGKESGKVRYVLPRSPLTDSGLFLSLARLCSRSTPSESGVVGWVEKHGVLLDEREAPEDPTQAAMKLETFRAEARRAHWLLNLYTDIRALDVAAITSRVSDPKSPLDERLREAFEEPREEGGTGVTLNSDERDILWLGYLILTEVLEERLKKVHPDTAVRSPEEFDPKAPRFDAAWRCPDLLSALYLQFYWLITSHTPMRRCANPACDMPFPLTRKDKRVCNDSCRSNVRHYR